MDIRRTLLALALVLPLGGTSPAAASPRTVLVETFGDVACTKCPDVRAALDGLDVGPDDRIVAIEYHVVSPLATFGVDLRQIAYGDPVVPTTFFDGADPVTGGGSLEAAYSDRIDTRLALSSPLLFDAVATFSTSALAGSLDVELEVEEDLPTPGAWTIRAVFVEDDVTACCGPGGQDTFHRVVRHILPARPLTIDTVGNIQFEQWDIGLDPVWEVTNLSAVVWIQRDSDNAVLGATLAADGGSLQPVPVPDVDLSRVNLLPARPSPFRSGQSRIPFTLPARSHVRVVLHDVAGRRVRILTDEVRDAGVHDVPWTGVDADGRPVASGVYFVRLEAMGAVRSQPLPVVRGR